MRRNALAGCALLFLLLFVPGCGSSQAATTNVKVTGTSMEPTLHVNEEVSVDTQAYASRRPSRGEVMLFHYPLDPTQEFIKRVIGIPGDTIQLTPTHVFLNGKLLKEPYISQPFNPISETISLHSDQYFVMGDNRPFSADSRSWGTLPRDDSIGKVILPSSFLFVPDMEPEAADFCIALERTTRTGPSGWFGRILWSSAAEGGASWVRLNRRKDRQHDERRIDGRTGVRPG